MKKAVIDLEPKNEEEARELARVDALLDLECLAWDVLDLFEQVKKQRVLLVKSNSPSVEIKTAVMLLQKVTREVTAVTERLYDATSELEKNDPKNTQESE